MRRGLFEKDKLTVATLVTTRILVDNDLLPGEDVSYLFLGKVHPDPGNMGPLHEWMPEQLWPKIKALEGLKQFSGLGDAMHSDSDDWLAWFDGAAPEVAKFPGDWQKNLSPFDRLILLRALRPDRCSNALAAWIGDVMGADSASDLVKMASPRCRIVPTQARRTSSRRPSTCPRRTRRRVPKLPPSSCCFLGWILHLGSRI